MSLLYFAYGSNMHPGRLRHRIDTVVPRGVARLPGHRLVFHKRGADGSGKGDVVPARSEMVWGVLYRVTAVHAARLDAIEGPGYTRTTVEVVHAGNDTSVSAFTYRARADAIAPELSPFSWYLDYLVRGALHHGLPADYVERLRQVSASADPELRRLLRERAVLETD